MLYLLTSLYLLLNTLKKQEAKGNPEASRLFEDLLARYNKLARPVRASNETIEIQFKLKLLQLLDVHWHDYRLEWNPAQYGNITMLHIPGQLIWLPDIILYNNAHGSPAVSMVTKADVYYIGQVTWEPPVVYNSVCKMNIEWFPYDEQHCDMKFGSWTFGGTELDLHHLESDDVERVVVANDTEWRVEMGVDLSEYQESVEWDLMSAEGTRHKKWYPCCDYPSIDITYYLRIRRKKLFYTINLTTPCIGIAVLASFVFYLPSESHNKITLCISVLVSLTVFFLLLIEIVPPTSVHIPLIAKYLMFTMVMVTLSVVVTVFVQNVHYRSEYDPMPYWMRYLFIHFLGRYLVTYRNRAVIYRNAVYNWMNNTHGLDSPGERLHKQTKKAILEGDQSQNTKASKQRRVSFVNENDTFSTSLDVVARAQANVRYIASTLAENSKNEQVAFTFV
ncbi:Acetylcholine receptor subunit alpha-type unc-63 [Toxocara canis]|uniref:Acetylcholine receptor subunit alpha-type unc-63 n=1 Tax=Toxocara canis TaxID=6265 RepID=A0A0B2VK74_TOXCA|nr:Acetylcholine receptor subunit alpha-type unc-63 [Toxocara canis]